MSTLRKIKRVVTGEHAIDGAGVHLVRVFGYYDTRDFDPFLMLDAFDSHNPEDYTKGFPWHPHRGIETITYLLEGDIEHGDSLGNADHILSGDCQWMTAGSGIIHQEMPLASKRMLGCQLWLNLPAKDKMTAPRYHALTADNIPLVKEGGASIRVLSGAYKDIAGAMKGDFVEAVYLDVELSPFSEWSVETKEEDCVFAYVLQGKAVFGDSEEAIAEKHAILFDRGDCITVKTTGQSVRFLLLSATPLREPIAWGGPIVMNTEEELSQAFRELDDGSFIKNQ